MAFYAGLMNLDNMDIANEYKKDHILICILHLLYNSIAVVMSSNPIQARIFFRLKFHNSVSCVDNCNDQLCLHILIEILFINSKYHYK